MPRHEEANSPCSKRGHGAAEHITLARPRPRTRCPRRGCCWAGAASDGRGEPTHVARFGGYTLLAMWCPRVYSTLNKAMFCRKVRGTKNAMELDDANEMVIREALRRLGPDAQLDPAILQEQTAEI